MEFCDECGSIMLPSKIKGKLVFKCKCGAIKTFDNNKSDAYKVSHGQKIQIEKLNAKEGDAIEFDNILLIADDKKQSEPVNALHATHLFVIIEPNTPPFFKGDISTRHTSG